MFYNRWCNSIPRAQVQGASCGSWGCFEKTGFLVNCQKYKIRQLRELKIGFCHKQFGKPPKNPVEFSPQPILFSKRAIFFIKMHHSFICSLLACSLTSVARRPRAEPGLPQPSFLISPHSTGAYFKNKDRESYYKELSDLSTLFLTEITRLRAEFECKQWFQGWWM